MGRALENPGRTDGGRTSTPKHLATSRGWGAELSQNPWISLLLEMKSGIKAQTRRLEYLPCACVFCSISWSLGHWVPPLPPAPTQSPYCWKGSACHSVWTWPLNCPLFWGKGALSFQLPTSLISPLPSSLIPDPCPKFQASHRQRHNTLCVAAAERWGHPVLVWGQRAELSARSSWCRNLSPFYHH